MADNKKHGCDCNHDNDGDCCHDHEMEEIITIQIDDDTEADCQVLGVFDVADKSYIALLPLEDDTVLLYGYKEGENDYQLIPIEDDDEFAEVSAAFDELMEDEDYEFEEYDDDDTEDDDDDDDSDDDY